MAQISKIVAIFAAAALLATVITGAVICTNAGNATTEEQNAETVVVNDINGDNATEEEIAQAWIKVIIPGMIAPYNNNSARSTSSVEEIRAEIYKVEKVSDPSEDTYEENKGDGFEEGNNQGLEEYQSIKEALSNNSNLKYTLSFGIGNEKF